jgi:transcription-repair coupling factor (superfamily II helicase)
MTFASALSHYIYNLAKNIAHFRGDVIFLSLNEEESAQRYKLAKFLFPDINAYLFPSWDTVPYDRVSPNKHILSARAKVLSQLVCRDKIQQNNLIVFTSVTNLIQKLPPKEIFYDRHLTVHFNGNIKQKTIVDFLIVNGFIRVSIATESGEFALRGDILDIVISSDECYRINFDWDNRCSIKLLDPISQISSSRVDKFDIYPSNEVILTTETIKRFKGNFLKYFGANYAEHPIYLGVSNGVCVTGAEHLLPLFYDKMCGLKDYLVNPEIANIEILEHAVINELDSIEDFYQSRCEANRVSPRQFYPILNLGDLYAPKSQICFDAVDMDNLEPNPALDFYAESLRLQVPVGDLMGAFVKNHTTYKIIICCWSISGLEKIKQILKLSDVVSVNIDKICDAKVGLVSIINVALEKSFQEDRQFFIRQQDVIGLKRLSSNISSSKKLKNILHELETLSEGELVVHAEHGIGQFIGIETIEVVSIRHDCMKIIYAGGDKLYIPVENLETVKKYGFADVPLDKLGGVAWQRRKSKLKNRIGEIAQTLIKLAAERKVIKIEPIFKNEEYDKFCAKFPYTETEDQLTAISDIENDLMSSFPMDRLICGDVGFGKTEVAMRAAFLVASIKKQVVVIVPTTILSRQHYTSFRERFIGSNLKLAQFSRLTPKHELSEIKAGLANGTIDIVIGTHGLFAKEIKFQDLGMLIIDEEQHFGVLQKEKLKELKHGTHVLSLSATPIPRTLQMSMIGIRDLSLIATPPIDRLPIRTYVIPYDQIIVRDALLREHARGGCSFYVCPRISDLADVAKALDVMVPELKYVIAHGQMTPSEIDEIMGDFYERKYDILLSTTIIGSGIDISSANTIIMHKAEILGLSQLYQLRGRVGRSKMRGVAYLIIGNSKTITPNALRRLEIMQNIDSLGAGFTIASYDSDIRGFGNLVGDEQSGHIKEVGAELYQDMLEEAINTVENTEEHKVLIPNINIGIAVYLPEEYIQDSDQRLALYKRASHLEMDEIENFRDELIDRFGPMPEPAANLLYVVKIKALCKKIGISDLDVGPNGILLKFVSNDLTSGIAMHFIQKYPRHTKLRPDNKLIILSDNNIKPDLMEVLSEMTSYPLS